MSSSGKHILCLVHIVGQFSNGGEGYLHYVGGGIRTKILKEDTTYEELRRIISSMLGKESGEIFMKFTLSLDDAKTYVDLVDDEGVEHFIKFNGESGHLYVGENIDDNIQPTRDVAREEQHMMDNSVESQYGLSMSTSILSNNDPPLLPCARQMTLAPIPEMNSTKWRELLIGEGQIFPNAVNLRQILYKYSIAHKFVYKFLKNNQQKIIVQCTIKGCPWYMGAYAMSKETKCLTIRNFKNEHIYHAQDNLVVPHLTRTDLTSSIIIDSLRDNIDKSACKVRKDMYIEYGVGLTYTQAYKAKAKSLNELHGCIEDSYTIIPWICNRLIESDPNTVARWEGSDCNRFERLFIAYGCSIKGFLGGCRGILYIDGCHLSGPYKGTLLLAYAYDADNELRTSN